MECPNLFFFRHGETDWNASFRIQGSTDIPLNALGHLQSQELRKALRVLKIETILSSDLTRARVTAEEASRGLGISILLDPRLREANYGNLEGRTRDEITAEKGPEFIQRLWKQPFTDAMAAEFQIEPPSQVFDRVMSAVKDCIATHPPKARIGFSSHGGVIRRLIENALQNELDNENAIENEPHFEHWRSRILNCTVYPFYWRNETLKLCVSNPLTVSSPA